MASIAMLVSEIAHSVNQADSVPVRRAIKLGIIHARNEIIRKSYNNHHFTDKVLQQRFKLTLVDVPDGDLAGTENLPLTQIKRTSVKVPRPTRLDSNLPFHSIRTAGSKNPIEVAFVKEASSKFYDALPGFCNNIRYDYINEYIYIFNANPQLGAIIIESVFELPQIIPTETVEGKFDIDSVSDEDEFLLPEDMIGAVKKVIFETWIPEIIRDTNEIPKDLIVR